MGAIAFSNKAVESWAVAGWAFRQILDDVASQHPHDVEMTREFEEAKAIGGLIVYKLERNVANRVTSAIREVVVGILSGTVRSGLMDRTYGNERTVEEYQKGLQQLLMVLRAAGEPPGKMQ